ncbi:MAG: ribonuclease III, partial [Clostridiales Family XIII bacterium]|nr:ribonuclease III [Clostridiales Family XIII bacterium]
IFLDGGWKKASAFVYNALEVSMLNAIESIGRNRDNWDRKTSLQIRLQKNGSAKISYKLRREEGPPHERLFFVDVCLHNRVIGSGSGYSKKEAEQDAAGHALEALNVLKED